MDAIAEEKSIDVETLGQADTARFFRIDRYDRLDCLAAHFENHTYPTHTHDTYVVGAIVGGCETYRINGVRVWAPAGSVCFVHPGDVHDGEPVGDGYAYRMCYPSVAVFAEIQAELGMSPGAPRFPEPVVADRDLAIRFSLAHRCLETSGAKLLADERMTDVLKEMLVRHAGATPIEHGGNEPESVRTALDYLDAHHAEDIDLAALVEISSLPRFRLIRAFSRHIGMTPHAYLIDCRVRRARDLLAVGRAPADVAIDTGFYDQAHLTRAFKARIGVTPGAYRDQLAA